MELMAAIIGLSALKERCRVMLYSDSQYLVESMTKGWVARWKANHWWRNKDEQAMNVDLWARVLSLCEQHAVTFLWVKGHDGHPENEACDRLSKDAARQEDLPHDEGYQPPEKSLALQKVTPLRPIHIQLDQITYIWTEKGWYDAKTHLEPPQIILNKLNIMLTSLLEQEDATITDIQELLTRAKFAKEAKQYQRSVKLARQALMHSPGHVGALAILSSGLRAIGHAQEALNETALYQHENYSPLLMSRAAAFCDVQQWDEAKKTIGRVLAQGGNEDAFSIVNRIKQARPDLYSTDNE